MPPPKVQSLDSTRKFILHSFPYQSVQRVWVGRTPLYTVIRDPALPASGSSNPHDPQVLPRSAGEGQEHENSGQNGLWARSEHSGLHFWTPVQWPEVGTRRPLTAKEAGKWGLPVLGWKARYNLVNGYHHLCRSDSENLFTTVASKVFVVPTHTSG